ATLPKVMTDDTCDLFDHRATKRRSQRKTLAFCRAVARIRRSPTIPTATARLQPATDPARVGVVLCAKPPAQILLLTQDDEPLHKDQNRHEQQHWPPCVHEEREPDREGRER